MVNAPVLVHQLMGVAGVVNLDQSGQDSCVKLSIWAADECICNTWNLEGIETDSLIYLD